jgi:hypothetical protein
MIATLAGHPPQVDRSLPLCAHCGGSTEKCARSTFFQSKPCCGECHHPVENCGCEACVAAGRLGKCYFCEGLGWIFKGFEPVDFETGMRRAERARKDQAEAAKKHERIGRRHWLKYKKAERDPSVPLAERERLRILVEDWTRASDSVELLSKCGVCAGRGSQPVPEGRLCPREGNRLFACLRCHAILEWVKQPIRCWADQGGCGRSLRATSFRVLQYGPPLTGTTRRGGA